MIHWEKWKRSLICHPWSILLWNFLGTRTGILCDNDWLPKPAFYLHSFCHVHYEATAALKGINCTRGRHFHQSLSSRNRAYIYLFVCAWSPSENLLIYLTVSRRASNNGAQFFLRFHFHPQSSPLCNSKHYYMYINFIFHEWHGVPTLMPESGI